jgi:hypothetical protein
VKTTQREKKDVRLPLNGDRLRKWEAMLSARGDIPQQTALFRMIDWVVKQDEALQAIVLGILTEGPDVVELLYKRHKGDPRHGMRIAAKKFPPPDKP